MTVMRIFSKVAGALVASAVLLGFSGFGVAEAAPFTGPTETLFEQTFDANADGWFDFGTGINPTQVASGTNGITSAAGAGHAEIRLRRDPFDSAFTGFGGFSSVWPGFIRQSLDVFIDPSQGRIGDGWALDNAVNNTAGSWLEAGGVGASKTAADTWSIAADGDGAGFTLAFGPALLINVADWYTIVSEWVENAGGTGVDRNTFIFNSSGTLLYSSEQLNQVSLVDIGGWRYGWVLPATSGAVAPDDLDFTLAIDNSRLEVLGIPEPGTLSVLGIALLATGLLRRRRRNAT